MKANASGTFAAVLDSPTYQDYEFQGKRGFVMEALTQRPSAESRWI